MIEVSEDLKILASQLTDFDLEAYLETVERPLPECVRLNTLKFQEEDVRRFMQGRGWRLEPIPWARHGYRVLEAPAASLGDTLEHMLGLFYLQGPVSMLPAEALAPEPCERCLDLCAAPGSKSTQLCQLVGIDGVVVANDVSKTRVKALSFNLQRWGAVNSIVTLADGRLYGRWAAGMFSKVLVDAPCSSLGVASKDWSVVRRFRSRQSKRLAPLQLALLEAGYKCLKPGGAIVYSTCTIHPLENEAVVSHFLERHPEARLEPVRPEGLRVRRPLEEFGSERFNPDVEKCFKCYPYDNGGEGFFIAKIVRGE
ncbi:MAG: RsmB/NOP family class I SAM-dependent RNA methyltransferase [Nitrososphaerota archaeon]|nr:RsmB/NOP family class I SAM-dependent RNA methyltransferase [Candidatus Calditenuaceae archaeon]MDW8072672.1 RsmB/NOP family class I SAM-dependent RNA methyltransferase [Nitrososphaerota archaeon]